MRRFLVLVLLSLTHCTAPLHGPDVDLATIAAPEAPVALPPVPQPAPGPTAPTGFFRAWIPRQTTASGDTTEGHFLTLSTTPPKVQTLEPDQPIPRVPRAKAEKPKPPTVQVPVSQLPAGTLPPGLTLGQPGLPQGGRE